MADSLELGATTGPAATPYIDFHTLGAATGDYEARIIASGGTPGVTASGSINVQAARLTFNGLAVATVFDVRDYGAVGNGTTDDTTAIQACINAAAGHGRVIIRADMVCLVSAKLLPPSNSVIILDGTLRLKAGANTSVIGIGFNVSNVLIEGQGTIDGNKAAQTGGFSEGIGSVQSSDITIRDVHITNCQNMPINIVSSSNCLIHNVRASNCGNSFEFAGGSTDCWAVGCTISGINDLGFCFYGETHRCGIVNSEVFNISGPGICVFSDKGQPGASTDILVAHNIVRDNVGNGIFVGLNDSASVSDDHKNVVITGNRCFNNLTYAQTTYGGAGVMIQDGHNILVSGNHIGPDAQHGPSGTAPAGLPAWGVSGIYVQGSSRVSNVQIEGNLVVDQGAGSATVLGVCGIYTDGADTSTTIANNTITDTRVPPVMGAGLNGRAGPGCVISNNIIRGTYAVSGMDTSTNKATVRNAGLGWVFEDGIEVGSTTTARPAYVDFHSSGTVRDYDARIIASGGSTTADAQGTLNYIGGQHRFTGSVTVVGAFAAGTTIGSTFPNSGLTAGWNLSASGGEVDLFLGRGSGAGGLNVYSVGPTGLVDSATPILGLDRNGVLAVSDINIAGSGGMAGAWTSVSAPVASSGGNLGSGAAATIRYKKFGRTVYFNVKVLIPHVGTASGNVQVTLPFTSAISSGFAGREGTTTGRGLNGITVDGGNVLYITDCNGNFAAPVDGATLVLNGVYEATA